jgi:hypothetical protein
MKPNTIRNLAPAFTFVISLLFAGCSHEFELKTKLLPDEHITEKEPVLVDGAVVGYVRTVRVESGDRIAVIALTDKALAQRQIKIGTVRVVEEGRIHLRTDLVRAESPNLQPGAFIPIQGQAEFTVKKYATNQTLAFVGIVLVAVLVLCLVFKKALNLGLVMLCLAMAGLTGWILHPHLVPRIEKFYASSPAIQNGADASEQNSVSGSDTSTPIKKWETTFIRVLEHRPNPRVAAFAAILVLSFIPYAILLGSAMRSLRHK